MLDPCLLFRPKWEECIRFMRYEQQEGKMRQRVRVRGWKWMWWALVPAAASVAASGPDRGLAPPQPRCELGLLRPGEGFRGPRNMYPTVAALPDGRLLLVWSSGLQVVGSWSHDQGRTWSAEESLIAVPGHQSADPTIIVTRGGVQVHSTTVPVPRKTVLTSDVYITEQNPADGSWSRLQRIPAHRRYQVGMIHTGLTLPDGTLVKPYAWDVPAEEGRPFAGEGKMYLRSGALLSRDNGVTWSPGGDISADPPRTSDFSTGGVCEPSMVLLDNGELYCLLRTADLRHWETRSRDGGRTWDRPRPSALAGHNTPAALCRLPGSREVLVVWNNSPRNRWPLDVALSRDRCRSWTRPRTLANPVGVQASYPTAAACPDGTLVAVWQQDRPDRSGRDLRIARFNRAWLMQLDAPDAR